MRRVVAVAMALLAMALSSCTVARHAAYSPQVAGVAPRVAAHHVVPRGPFIGVYEAGAVHSYAPVTAFDRKAGMRANLLLAFSGWHEPFLAGFAQRAREQGALPLIQINPTGTTLTDIINGDSDTYLRSYAVAVADYRYPVVLSFGHEMNGNWYPWSSGHVMAATFVAAWRHVVSMFRREGAGNAIWLWTVSANATAVALRPWWPGAGWTDWVGIDGYYYFPSETYASVIGPTLARIRAFTDAPVLLSEVAIGTTKDRAGQINGLFRATSDDHLLGIVWFDVARHDPPLHQDWRLEDDPAALRTFARDAKIFLRERHPKAA
jgi:mannan endo-1,4-beta-mannosidase